MAIFFNAKILPFLNTIVTIHINNMSEYDLLHEKLL